MKINHNPEILVNGYDELRDLFTRTLIAAIALLLLPVVAVNGAKTVDTLSELPYQGVVALVAAQESTADFMASGFYEGVASTRAIAPMIAYEATSGAADLLSLYQKSFDQATLLAESAVLAFGKLSDGIADNAYAAVVSIPHDMTLLALNHAQASQPQAMMIDQGSQEFFSQT
ncbi:MAG TPA: hypothetical protein VEA37_14215, partial [Flavobacterium sp.]|nr:hypothetical protein [Flavobacterium sp.]